MVILIFKFKRGAIVNYQADVNYLKRACDTKSPCVGRCGATSAFSARLPDAAGLVTSRRSKLLIVVEEKFHYCRTYTAIII